MGTLHEDVFTFMTISRYISLRMRNALEKVVEKIKTNISCSITFSENCTVYEIMSKNTVEPERPQITTQYGVQALLAGLSKATRPRPRPRTRTRTRTRTRPRARAPPPPTHTHTDTRNHPWARARKYTHRQLCNTYCSFMEITIRERAPMLRYTHTECHALDLLTICIYPLPHVLRQNWIKYFRRDYVLDLRQNRTGKTYWARIDRQNTEVRYTSVSTANLTMFCRFSAW
jgi:hypothetical protein